MLTKFVRKHYQKLLSISVIVILLSEATIRVMTMGFGYTADDEPLNLLMKALSAPILISFMCLYGLIFIRSFRDEYVDALWQKSIRAYAIIILSAPWLFLFAKLLKFLFWPDAHWLHEDPNELLFSFNGEYPHNVSQLQFSGVTFTLGAIFDLSPLVFAALYTWYAWRDRRG